VQTGRTATIGWIARLVLLGCTLFGLAAMHTIGHGGMIHADHHGEIVTAAGHQSPGTLRFASAESDGCAGDGCLHVAALPSNGGQMDRWDLCVAVLNALPIALLLVALLLAAVTGRFPPHLRNGDRRPGLRAPPIAAWGLTLATVSVLRT
jgi:Family of unknown function (DUF6153)